MNFIVIGLGSMGKRRIRLLQEYIKRNDKESWTIFGLDSREERRSETESKYGIYTAETMERVLNGFDIDAVFVCTSPLSHSGIITECLNRNLHVFTEINVVADGYEKNVALAKEKSRILYLSSTPMHRREIKYIRDWVREVNYRLTYRYHVGQYLPEWHPWENYKDFFVGDRRTNACREIFAIELPWLIESFGSIDTYTSEHDKLSQLDIDYDDVYHVVLRHSTGIMGCLAFDIISPKAECKLEAFGENRLLSWGGTPDSLQILSGTKEIETVNLYEKPSHERGYEQYIIEDAYYEEIRDFIKCIEQNINPLYTFEMDSHVLKIIDGIEA